MIVQLSFTAYNSQTLLERHGADAVIIQNLKRKSAWFGFEYNGFFNPGVGQVCYVEAAIPTKVGKYRPEKDLFSKDMDNNGMESQKWLQELTNLRKRAIEKNMVTANTLDWEVASVPLSVLPFLTRSQPPWTTQREPSHDLEKTTLACSKEHCQTEESRSLKETMLLEGKMKTQRKRLCYSEAGRQ